MNYKEIILKYFIIILGGFFVFYLESKEVLEPHYTTMLVVIIALIKLGMLFFDSYSKIMEISMKNVAFHKFLIFMFINVMILIISFSVDFLCLYEINPSNFEGLPKDLSYGELFFEFIYLSMLGFNNLGFYDVVPKSMAARTLVILEIISYFLTIVFVLSDFVSLKDSIAEIRKKKEK